MSVKLKLFTVSIGLLTLGLFINSCGSGSKKNKGGEVKIHILSDPEMLNPVNSADALGSSIMYNVFQKLLNIDFKTLQMVPVLAKSRPQIEITPANGMRITFEIRDEAKWDNGSPVTAADVVFTIKAIKNPKVKSMDKRAYYDFISDIQLYPDNPKKLTFVSNQLYIRAEYTCGAECAIMPEYAYDPKGIMRKFTVAQLSDSSANLSENADIIAFAQEFNSEKYMREKEFISGSGAYTLDEWKTGQSLTLKRKANWWGNKLDEENTYFVANAPKITYQTINDQTTALVALKAGNIDVMYGIKAKDFVELPKSSKFVENYTSYTPAYLAFSYIGLNNRTAALSSQKSRQAFAYIIDVESIIKTVVYGYGKRVTGTIHPSKVKDYDSTLVPYPYNVEKAKAILAEDGWADTDGNGTLDKVIKGEKVDFNITFSYNSGNDERKSVGLIIKEEAAKLGITVNVVAQEWSVYLGNLKQHKFDMYYGSWIGEYAPENHSQLFATESANNGSNYTCFGNAESDKLIDEINREMDENKRSELYKKFQRMLYEDCSYIYMFTPPNKLAISKKFDNAYPSAMYPGFWVAGFTIAK